MTTRRETRRYTTPEAVADALDQVSPLIRAGVIVAFSLEWHPTGTARVAYLIAAGLAVDLPDLPGVAMEEDDAPEP